MHRPERGEGESFIIYKKRDPENGVLVLRGGRRLRAWEVTQTWTTPSIFGTSLSS